MELKRSCSQAINLGIVPEILRSPGLLCILQKATVISAGSGADSVAG